jgi:hypothetical protein
MMNITDGIPSEIYVAIGRDRYSDEYEVARETAAAVREESAAELAALRSQLAAERQLKEAAEKERDRMARMYRDGFDVQRVMEWQRQPSRREPHLEFTAGGERDAAHLIEDERRAIGVKLAAAEARAAGLAKYRVVIRDVISELGDQEASGNRPHTHVDFDEQINGLVRLDEAIVALLAPAAEEGAGDGK